MEKVLAIMLIEFITYQLVYRFVFGIVFKGNIKRYCCSISILIISQLFLCVLVGKALGEQMMFLTNFLAILVLSQEKWKKTAALYLVVVMLSSLMMIFFAYMYMFIGHMQFEQVIDTFAGKLMVELAGMIFFMLIGTFRKRVRELAGDYVVYLVLNVGAVCIFLTIAYSQMILIGGEPPYSMKKVLAFICILFAIAFIILGICTQFIWVKFFSTQQENRNYEIYLSGQEKHIRELLFEDERRRKMRHDVNSHMLAINGLLEEQNYDELKEYIEKINQNLDSYSIEKNTYISAVDSIISECHKRAEEKGIQWKFKGTRIEDTNYSYYDLCIIFSNLLNNALEASEKCPIDKRKIEIRVKSIQNKLVINIRNTCLMLEQETAYISKKGDELLHGLGLKNVRETVEKYDGNLETEFQEKWHIVNVII